MSAEWIILVAIIVLLDVIIRLAAIIIVPRNRRPSSAMAWLTAIFFVPYLGALLYLLVGSSKLPKKRRDKQDVINAMISEAASRLDLATDTSTWPAWFGSVVTLNESLGAVPMVSGNRAHLIGDYTESIQRMAAEIDTAETFVHVEFFILALDDTTAQFFRAMEAAVQRGVTVRVLLDHVASTRSAHHRKTFAELDRIGAHWAFMLPLQPLKGKYQRPDLRGHRKLLIVDGRVGYIGSQNVIDRSYNSAKNIRRGLQWQDLMARVTGPVVTGINVIFLSDWYSETDEILTGENVRAETILIDTSPDALDCQIVPSGPGFEGENNLQLFLTLIYSAQHQVVITSPYFVPDEAMMYAIISSCRRGVDVQLFVSEIGDQVGVFHAQRSYYSALLEAGVHIWMYPAPYILHAKHLSIDDDVAVIGSSNMDIRSFSLDLEVSMLVRGKSFVSEMRAVEDGYRQISRELTLAEWNNEPFTATVLDGVARLTSSFQ